jgi:N-acetylglutamate synthase-like GNAT family acetyltransferase
VSPSHRKSGAGRALLQWGKDKADELRIETVISSLPSAKGAYEKCGFGCIEVLPADAELWVEKEGRGEKWKELLEEDLSGWLVWRPVGRDWREGDQAPWLDSEKL